MKLIRDKRIRTIVLIMLAVVVVSLVGAQLYYSQLNNRVDPRIKAARVLYEDYNKLAESGDYHAVLELLDTVENIYNSHPHYQYSYETGVIANNRAAVFLTIALHRDSLPAPMLKDISRDSLIAMAEAEVCHALYIYKYWKRNYLDKDRQQWQKMIDDDFSTGFEEYTDEQVRKYLENRLDEFEDARTEINRRLSVSHNNLGMIYRYRQNYDSALVHYNKAIELWSENLTARNNLNVLLNRPKEKRSMLRKLFPPPKDKSE